MVVVTGPGEVVPSIDTSLLFGVGVVFPEPAFVIQLVLGLGLLLGLRHRRRMG